MIAKLISADGKQSRLCSISGFSKGFYHVYVYSDLIKKVVNFHLNPSLGLCVQETKTGLSAKQTDVKLKVL